MAGDDKPRGGRASQGARPSMKALDERPFDLWLQKQLHAMYDEIASEPLPTDLLKLIDRDASKPTAPRNADDAEPRGKDKK